RKVGDSTPGAVEIRRSGFKPASCSAPCRICGAKKRCSETRDGGLLFCYRESYSAEFGPGQQRSGQLGTYWRFRTGPQSWLPRRGRRGQIAERATEPPAPAPAPVPKERRDKGREIDCNTSLLTDRQAENLIVRNLGYPQFATAYANEFGARLRAA